MTIVSQFANQLLCPHCSKNNTATTWPRLGDAVPFFYQTKEETIDTPGAYNVRIHCSYCEKDWFVVWDDDPR
jgi:hypothetical protein